MFSIFSKNKKIEKSSPIEFTISEIEVFIAYGLPGKAKTLMQELLAQNPANEKVLELSRKVAKL